MITHTDPLKAAIELLQDDGYAALFQSLSQYRSALVKALTAQSAAAKTSTVVESKDRIGACMPDGSVVTNVYEAFEAGKRSAISASQPVADEREAFEQWAKSHGGLPLDLANGMQGRRWLFCTYRDSCTEIAWRAWVNKHARAAIEADRNKRSAAPVSAGLTKLLVDVATAVMEERRLLSRLDDKDTQAFCEELDAEFARALESRLSQRVPVVSAAPAGVMVPDGWKPVPNEITPEMRKAAADAWLDCGSRLTLNKAAAALIAGIKAAPMPKQQEG